ncbi:hypothetical protein C8R45DRAFT_1112670 [Mycena sanguinolenta]|nr:hypothetical protein C8R45DRAFT_1112670 [Mycena sanguinolenta]
MFPYLGARALSPCTTIDMCQELDSRLRSSIDSGHGPGFESGSILPLHSSRRYSLGVRRARWQSRRGPHLSLRSGTIIDGLSPDADLDAFWMGPMTAIEVLDALGADALPLPSDLRLFLFLANVKSRVADFPSRFSSFTAEAGTAILASSTRNLGTGYGIHICGICAKGPLLGGVAAYDMTAAYSEYAEHRFGPGSTPWDDPSKAYEMAFQLTSHGIQAKDILIDSPNPSNRTPISDALVDDVIELDYRPQSPMKIRARQVVTSPTRPQGSARRSSFSHLAKASTPAALWTLLADRSDPNSTDIRCWLATSRARSSTFLGTTSARFIRPTDALHNVDNHTMCTRLHSIHLGRQHHPTCP